MYTPDQKATLLSLARSSIVQHLKKGETLSVDEGDIDKDLKELRGTFVTLTINEELRGCIGHIDPVQELYRDILENAVHAAVHDPRFPKLTLDELEKTTIEISILSLPKELAYADVDDLLQKLKPNKHGVIIHSGFQSATFLPQVWEEVPKKEDFLSHLCMKAGLSQTAWRNGALRVETYTVEHFSEKKSKKICN